MNSKAPSNAVSSAKSGGIGHSSDAEESELPGYQWDESIFVSLLAADFSQEDFQKLERNLNDIALLNRMVEVFHKTKAQKAEISRLEERLSLMTKLLGESYGMMPATIEQRLTAMAKEKSSSSTTHYAIGANRAPDKVTTVVAETTEMATLEKNFTERDVHKFIEYLRRCNVNGIPDKRATCVCEAAKIVISVRINVSDNEFANLPVEELIKKLEVSFPKGSQLPQGRDWAESFAEIWAALGVRNRDTQLKYIQEISTVLTEATVKDTPEQTIVNALISGAPLSCAACTRQLPRAGQRTVVRPVHPLIG